MKQMVHSRAGVEEKAGKSFEGIHGLMNNSSELLALDSLTPREREFVESLQRYSNISIPEILLCSLIWLNRVKQARSP